MQSEKLVAVKAAEIIDSATVTADRAAEIFNEDDLSADKSAEIMAASTLNVDKSAAILESDELTSGKGAAVLQSVKIEAVKAADIIDSNQISSKRAGNIVNEDALSFSKAANILLTVGDVKTGEILGNVEKVVKVESIIGASPEVKLVGALPHMPTQNFQKLSFVVLSANLPTIPTVVFATEVVPPVDPDCEPPVVTQVRADLASYLVSLSHKSGLALSMGQVYV